jgi:hypothetical protein
MHLWEDGGEYIKKLWQILNAQNMRINRILKKRLRRLGLDAKAGLTGDNPQNLKVYITEFNDILTELKKQGIGKDVSFFTYKSGQDENYGGGISYDGKAKIQNIITKSQNILDEKIEEEQKSSKILWKGAIGVLFSGLMLFLFNYFYTLGIKHSEKQYDVEKIQLYEQNVKLKSELDSCKISKTSNYRAENENSMKMK